MVIIFTYDVSYRLIDVILTDQGIEIHENPQSQCHIHVELVND
jgi:hypothetical protein